MLNRIKRTGFGLVLLSWLLFGGCNSSGSNVTQVTVTDQSGNQQPDVTVVLGDSNGAMKTYGTTNAAGQITFADPPANATVTTAYSCLQTGTTTTIYSLDTRYDVNGPVALQLAACSASSDVPAAGFGTVTINVTNTINGITQNEISTSNGQLIGYSPSVITQATVSIFPFDLQSDGKLSLVVIGRDANNTAIGYGALLDQTLIDGMTINIAVDKPMRSVQYQITNIPATATSLCPSLPQLRTGKGFFPNINCRSLSSAETSTTISVPYAPGLGDQFIYGVSVDTYRYSGNSNPFDSHQYIGITGPFATVPSDQILDLSRMLSAPSIVISGASTSTPTFSWSNVDLGATDTSLFAEFRLPSAAYLYVNLYNVSRTRTSITFPELPDSLAAFRPTGVGFVSLDTSAAGDLYRSSGDTYFGTLAFSAQLRDPALQKLRSLGMRPGGEAAPRTSVMHYR
jgi:hypothetical protein